MLAKFCPTVVRIKYLCMKDDKMKGAPDDKCHHHLSFIDHHDWQTSRRQEFTGQKSISHLRQTATIGL